MAMYKNLLKLSRYYSSRVTSIQKPPTLSSKFCEEFNDFYPKFLDAALERNKYFDHECLRDRLKRVAEYFPLVKFPLQGEFFVHAYELLEKPENLKSDMINQAYCLAYASEAFQAYYIIQDDVLDKNKTRAGNITWHLLPDASCLALNDTCLLRSLIDDLLRQNFDKSIYVKVLDVFIEMYLAVDMGQVLDILLSKTDNYNDFSMENYNRMIYMKGSCYSMNSPILLALILSNKATAESFQIVEDLFTHLGGLIQIHNDYTEYLNYDESLVVKSSTDIETGKCTWPAVVALQHFNTEQRKVFNENYRSPEPEKIKRVMELYDRIDMRKLYKEEESARYDIFLRKVRELPPNTTPSPDFLMKILAYFQGYASNTSRFYYI